MNSGELLVILIVALVVFGPNKLPMLAEHLGKLYRHVLHLKKQIELFWQATLAKQQLQENQRKAEEADAVYDKEKKIL